MADSDDMPKPPPGGFLRDPGPAGPQEAERADLDRIATALEGVREEMTEIRSLLSRIAGSFGR